MWDLIRSLVGDITHGELALVGVLFVSILFFSWSPRIGEAVGRLFGRKDEGA